MDPDKLCETGTVASLALPLIIWFFVTAAAGVAGIVYFVVVRRASKQADDHPALSGSVHGSVVSKPRTRNSWEIALKELRFGPRVGIGNVGEVYKGTFRGREVAIKRLLPLWLNDEDMVARFREEIQLMATMNHPNVLHFVGAVLDRDAGHVCLVTELCSRGTLHEVLHSAEPLPWRTRLRMAWEIARGMGYLHEQARVIQRDLKTQNLLVTEHLEVKISDFGLSRGLAPVMETYCGTPATMAPEITRQAVYDQRADIFSFGIIMWEILTRQEPYPGLDGLSLALQVAERGMRPAVPSYCPAEWAALMVRAWDSDPSVRPSFDFIQRELMRMMNMLDEADAAAEGQTQGSLSGMGGSRLVDNGSLSVARKKRVMAGVGKDVLLIPKTVAKASGQAGWDDQGNGRSSAGGSMIVGSAMGGLGLDGAMAISPGRRGSVVAAAAAGVRGVLQMAQRALFREGTEGEGRGSPATFTALSRQPSHSTAASPPASNGVRADWA